MAKSNAKFDIEKLLEDPLISNSILAQTIWPEITPSSAVNKLAKKKHNLGYQRILPDDAERIQKAMNEFLDRVTLK